MIYIILILLTVLSGISKAITDVSALTTIKDKLSQWGLGWWKKSYSSNNKYKNLDPAQGERFFLSTTLLVFLTDAWHLFGFLQELFMGIVIFMIAFNFSWKFALILFTCLYFLRQIVFELVYRYLKTKYNR